jgi:hypothetical protein
MKSLMPSLVVNLCEHFNFILDYPFEPSNHISVSIAINRHHYFNPLDNRWGKTKFDEATPFVQAAESAALDDGSIRMRASNSYV